MRGQSGCEVLETRRLFAVLLIQGTAGADAIEVWSSGGTINWSVNDVDGSATAANYTHVEVRAGAGDDSIDLSRLTVRSAAYGAYGDDQITGGAGADSIYAGPGNDMISGGKGADSLCGQGDNDQIYGNGGLDYILGGAGNDWIYGNEGNDLLDGADGNDYLTGGAGNDTIKGGTGVDTALYSDHGTSGVKVSLDRLANDGGVGEYDNADADGSVENITGSAGNDVLTGNAVGNRIDGAAGNDSIVAGKGNDVVFAGSGADTVFTGLGDDVIRLADGQVDRCTGGAGTDEVVGDLVDVLDGVEDQVLS